MYLKMKVLAFALVLLSSCGSSWGQISVTISSPHSGESIAQIYQTQGVVSSSAAPITDVSASIDGGPYSPTALFGAPPGAWLTAIYAKLMPVGPHTIAVKGTDALGNVGLSPVVAF